jgi:hypothetical protein
MKASTQAASLPMSASTAQAPTNAPRRAEVSVTPAPKVRPTA